MSRRHVLVILWVVLALALAGCGKSEKSTPSGELDPIVEAKCTMCHTLDRVTAASYDAAGWEEVVDRMVSNGMVVTDEEKRQLVDALSGGAN